MVHAEAPPEFPGVPTGTVGLERRLGIVLLPKAQRSGNDHPPRPPGEEIEHVPGVGFLKVLEDLHEEGQVVGFSPLTFVGTVMVMRGSAN